MATKVTFEGGGKIEPQKAKQPKATDTKGTPPRPRVYHKPARSGYVRPFTNRAR